MDNISFKDIVVTVWDIVVAVHELVQRAFSFSVAVVVRNRRLYSVVWTGY